MDLCNNLFRQRSLSSSFLTIQLIVVKVYKNYPRPLTFAIATYDMFTSSSTIAVRLVMPASTAHVISD